jgi:hypothetical protein
VAQIASGVGALGLAIALVALFIRGDIISKSILDRILVIYEKQMQDGLDRFTKSLDTSLERQTAIFSEKMEQIIERFFRRERERQ